MELDNEDAEIKDYNEIQQFLQELTDKDAIIFDANKTNATLFNSINSNAVKIPCSNVTTKLKGIKNETEIENIRNCEIKDGTALVKFIKWLKESVGKEEITEFSAGEN